jgi:hypothetical protein
MTDILTNINSLPQEIKTYIYGFIHIDVRIAILKDRYRKLFDFHEDSDKYLDLNQCFRHFSIDTIYKFEKLSTSLFVSLGCEILENTWTRYTYLNTKTIFKNFPELPSTTYRVNDRVKTNRHPFITNIISNLPDMQFLDNREPKYIRKSGRLISSNMYSNIFLLESESFDFDFDNVLKTKILKFFIKLFLVLDSKNVNKDIINARREIKLKEFIRELQRNEKKVQRKEASLMRKEEKLSQIQENWKEKQLAKKLERLEREANERKQKRIALRKEKENQREKEKLLRQQNIKLRKEKIIKNREIRNRKKKQLEEDRLYLHNFNKLFSKPKITLEEKQEKKALREKQLKEKQEKKALREKQLKDKKALREKQLREKEMDKIDNYVCKEMQRMFKPVKQRKKI